MSITIKNTAQHVLSVILCLSVIMSINIKNKPQHVLSAILCLYVIMSITIKNTARHVLSVIICLSVILSINIKNTARYFLSIILCLFVIMSINIKKHASTCSFCHSLSLCHYVYKYYISIQYVCFIHLCNPHEIKRLQTALKKGLVKHQEGRVLGRRRACSRMEKSMFSNGEGHVLERSEAGGVRPLWL